MDDSEIQSLSSVDGENFWEYAASGQKPILNFAKYKNNKGRPWDTFERLCLSLYSCHSENKCLIFGIDIHYSHVASSRCHSNITSSGFLGNGSTNASIWSGVTRVGAEMLWIPLIF